MIHNDNLTKMDGEKTTLEDLLEIQALIKGAIEKICAERERIAMISTCRVVRGRYCNTLVRRNAYTRELSNNPSISKLVI